MDKYNTISSNSVFGQLISLLPKDSIIELIQQHGSDRYTKRFKTMDHLLTMLFASFTRSSVLREIEASMAGFARKLERLGVNHLPKRSTLSDANNKRDASVFEAIYHQCYSHLRHLLPDSYPKNEKWMEKLFIVDSTTITLFKEILKACGNAAANGRKKGGVKIHIGMHLSESVPSMACITSAATSDTKFMPRFKNMPADTILVFDKAYVNYGLYNHWSNTQVKFVTRLHGHSKVEVQEELSVDREQQKNGVYRAQIVQLGHSQQKDKVKCRLIYFYDKDKNRVLKFLTNDFSMSLSKIAEIYKQRWQIEMLFKRLKQNLQLSDFVGDNENAIRIQIWTNLIADLLLTIIKKGVKRKMAYSNIAALVRIHLLSFVKLNDLLLKPGDKRIYNNNSYGTQLSLYSNTSP